MVLFSGGIWGLNKTIRFFFGLRWLSEIVVFAAHCKVVWKSVSATEKWSEMEGKEGKKKEKNQDSSTWGAVQWGCFC